MKNLNSYRSSYLPVTAILIAIISLTYSCTKDSMDDNMEPAGGSNAGLKAPGANEVWIQASAFTPETITVTTGTTITWTNKEGSIHTVTSDTGLFNSGNMGINGTFSFKFNVAGTFLYHCILHPTMTAKVVVN